MLKTAVFAPIPNARVAIAMAAKPGLRRRKRSAYLRSASMEDIWASLVPRRGVESARFGARGYAGKELFRDIGVRSRDGRWVRGVVLVAIHSPFDAPFTASSRSRLR